MKIVKKKKNIIIISLILIIFLAILIYFWKVKPSPDLETAPAEKSTLSELLDELTPKNAPPLTAEEIADLERLKEELTP
jgi:flagellar basal body-associated protein FliL